MAFRNTSNTIGFTAGGTISQAGLLLKLDSTYGQVVVATATSEALIGVSMAAAGSGEQVPVACIGSVEMVKVGSGGATMGVRQMFVTGAKITDVSGNVETIGLALKTGVDGDEIPVLINPLPVGTDT